MGDLADALKISLSTLSRQLQQQKTLSLVTITRSESDSSKTVVLNEQGIKKISELKNALDRIEKSLFNGFSEQEIKSFTKMFNELVQRSRLNLPS